MESDYGWSQYDIESTEYGETDSNATAEVDDVDMEYVEEPCLEYIPLKKQKVVDKKKASKSVPVSRGKKSNGKRKRRRLTGAEEFFQLVLSWSIEKLLLDSRKALGLAPLGNMPSCFENKLVYYETMRQVAVEEARASLSQGLRIMSDNVVIRLSKVQIDKEESQLVLVMFKIISGGVDLTRPGSAFKLIPSDFKLESNRSGDNNNAYRSNYKQNVYTNTNDKHDKQMKRDGQDGHSKATLAVVAQGSAAMALSSSMGGFNSVLPLWIHSTSPLAMQLADNGELLEGSDWTAYSICSVLSYQRMATVCTDSPSPSFMHKILGYRPASHIKFDSDDDDDGSHESEKGGRDSIFGETSSDSMNGKSDDNKANKMKIKHSNDEGDSNNSSDSDSENENENEEEEVEEEEEEEVEKNIHLRAILQSLSSSSRNKVKSLNVSQKAALILCLNLPANSSSYDTQYSDDTQMKNVNKNDNGDDDDDLNDSDADNDNYNDDNNRNNNDNGNDNKNDKNKNDKLTEKLSIAPLNLSNGNLHLILGPPGCGKTHFLVSLLHSLIGKDNVYNNDSNENVRIMVCAPSNKAVCVVLEQFLQSGMAGGVYKNNDKNEKNEINGKNGKSGTKGYNGKNEINGHNKYLRCSLIGVSEKLDVCSGSETAVINKTQPYPLLPSSITDCTRRFLYPINASDIFVSTYGTGISTALNAIIMYLKTTILLLLTSINTILNNMNIKNMDIFRKFVENGRISRKEFGTIMLLQTTVSALRSECQSLFYLLKCDVSRFYFNNLNVSWQSADRLFGQLLDRLYFREILIQENKNNGVRKDRTMKRRIDMTGISNTSLEIPDCNNVTSYLIETTNNDDNINNSNSNSNNNNNDSNSNKNNNNNKNSKNKNENENENENGENKYVTSSISGIQGLDPLLKKPNTPLECVENIINDLKYINVKISTQIALEEISALVLQSSSIIFCTLATSGSNIVIKNVTSVDVLIVDEAAQALEVELLIPLTIGAKNLILVGDPKQLPACVLSHENQQTKRGESLMQRLIERCAYPCNLLDTQYRMHPAISLLPNRLFYENSLRDDVSVIKRANLFQSKSKPKSSLNNTTLPASTPISTSISIVNKNKDNQSHNSDTQQHNKKEEVEEVVAFPEWLENFSFIDVPGGSEGEKGGGPGGKSLSNEAEAVMVVK